MAGFSTVLTNVLVMLFYLFCGAALMKFRKGSPDHGKTLSGLLIYVCTPALVISSFQALEFSTDTLKKLGMFLFASLFIQLVFFFCVYMILRKKMDNALNRIFSIASILGNVGFFGLPVVKALFPGEPIAPCYSLAYVISMNFIVFTLGEAMITNDKKYITLKSAILNPTIITALIALPLFCLNIKLPTLVGDTMTLLGKMTTPICMIVLGMRLSAMSIKSIFTARFAYMTGLMKLIVYPLFAYLCVAFIPGLDEVFKISILMLSAAPSASVILSLSEIHECEREASANVVILTTLLCVITMPLLILIFG